MKRVDDFDEEHKAPDHFVPTEDHLRQIDLEHNPRPVNRVNKITTPEDMMDYLHSEKMLNSKRMLRSRK